MTRFLSGWFAGSIVTTIVGIIFLLGVFWINGEKKDKEVRRNTKLKDFLLWHTKSEGQRKDWNVNEHLRFVSRTRNLTIFTGMADRSLSVPWYSVDLFKKKIKIQWNRYDPTDLSWLLFYVLFLGHNHAYYPVRGPISPPVSHLGEGNETAETIWITK